MVKGRVMASTKNRGDEPGAAGERRLLGYVAPWMGLFAAVLFGGVAHRVFGSPASEQTAAATVVLTLSGGGLTYVAWDSGKPRGRHMQIFATAFTAVCSLWAVAVTIYGLTVRPVWASLLFLVLFVAAHNIRRGLRGQGEDDQAGVLDKKIAEQKRQIKNPRVDAETGIVRARVIADRQNETIEDVQKQLPAQIESIKGLGRGSVTITEDRKDRGAGELMIVPGNALEGIVAWPGPTAVGGSIELPIPTGLYVDYQPQKLWLPGDAMTGRNASHFKVMGVNGSGKSEAMKVVVTEALTRNDFVLFASDHIKGHQTFGSLLEFIDWPVVNEGGNIADAKRRAMEMLKAVRGLVSCNADMLGKAGFKQWSHKAYQQLGVPLTMVWIEEAAEVTGDSVSFTRLCQQARSAGIILVWSAQRASFTSIDTDARSQLTTEWCFGVSSSGASDDAKFGLPEAVLDAGANPDQWGNRKPGMNYLVAPGIDEDRWAMQARVFFAGQDDTVFAEILTAHAGRARLHPEGIKALGEPYARRQVFTASDGYVPPVSYSPEVPPVDFSDDDMDTEGMVGLVDALDPELRVDGSEPIGEPDVNLPFGVPAPARKLGTTEAQAVVQQHLRTLLDDGLDRTQAADVVKMKPETTRSSEWVRGELKRLCAAAREGEIALERHDDDDPGVFRIVGVVGAVAGDAVARM